MSIVDKAKTAAQGLTLAAMAKLVPLAPDICIPGGVPDPLIARKHGLIGTQEREWRPCQARRAHPVRKLHLHP
jgi:hypothetical protein